MNVIKAAREKTGQQVVVVIDEYDKPLLESLDNKELQEQFRLNKAYESICGMTATEIEANFAPELDKMAASNGISRTEIMKRMETMYDGYRFCDDQAQGMFNPFSVLNTLDQKKFSNYWFVTGTPTFLVKMLQRTNFDIRELVNGIEVSEASLNTYQADEEDPVPMIYQRTSSWRRGCFYDPSACLLRKHELRVERRYRTPLPSCVLHRAHATGAIHSSGSSQ